MIADAPAALSAIGYLRWSAKVERRRKKCASKLGVVRRVLGSMFKKNSWRLEVFK